MTRKDVLDQLEKNLWERLAVMLDEQRNPACEGDPFEEADKALDSLVHLADARERLAGEDEFGQSANLLDEVINPPADVTIENVVDLPVGGSVALEGPKDAA